MTDLDNIPIPSITDMTPDEAIEYLRQIRLSRRTPSPQSTKRKEAKAREKAPPKLSAEQAAELLKLLEEGL